MKRRIPIKGRIKKSIAPLIATLLIAVCETSAFAHGGKPHNWHDLVRTWSWEPLVVISLALSGGLYLLGLRRLWGEAAPGKGIRKWEAASFAGGWLALFIALVSPLHPWGRVLFSAHMTQHEVLMLVAAPLFVLSRPMLAFLKALPASWAATLARGANARGSQCIWGFMTHAFVAW